ncbi:MAG: hypothetical protein VW338_10840 [Rhodospirillaceae bacterium]
MVEAVAYFVFFFSAIACFLTSSRLSVMRLLINFEGSVFEFAKS